MGGLRQRQSWRWRERQGRENVCKTMHLMHGLIPEKGQDLRGFFEGLLRGQFSAFSDVILVLRRREFFTIIIP